MFIKTKRAGYDSHGEQVASGLFLILMQPKNDTKTFPLLGSAYPIKAIVRHVAMRQLGNFMMGFARVHGTRLTLSGSYGGDGLPDSVPDTVYQNYGLPLPQELYNAWKDGGGWNGAGSEAPLMRKWALENLEALRK